MPESTNAADQFSANPQITEVTVGVRNLRTITLYPLSMADQMSVTDLISKALSAFASRGEEDNEMEFIALLVGLVKENILKILEMVTDEKGEDLAKELTNVQSAEIAEIIYDVNFGEMLKNAQSLVEKVKTAFPSTRPLPTSVSSTADIDLKTFTESRTEREAPPSPK